MATWTAIPDTSINIGKPVRSIDGFALRDNPIAIAQGATGAPKIETLALDINAVLEATARDYTFGALGTHAFLWRDSLNTSIVAGTSYAGSGLKPAGLSTLNSITGASGVYYGWDDHLFVGANSPTMLGTWLALGSTYVATTPDNPASLFVRIA